MYRTTRGIMAIKNVGVAMVITTSVLITVRRVSKTVLDDLGMTPSIVYMSLENRFKIRPRGVVSKNDIGDRRMFLSILLCRVLEAKTPAVTREKEPTRTNND